MFNRAKYLYHLVNRSSRAFSISFFSFFIMSGFVCYFMKLKPFLFRLDLSVIGLVFLVWNVIWWYDEVITESTFSGFHTTIVQLGLEQGFILFIISEIMLFAGFFWAFFHVSMLPDVLIGVVWPPRGIMSIDALDIPLFNTLLLLLSSWCITLTHYAITNDSVIDTFDSFLSTIFMGFLFLTLQGWEYYLSTFNFNDSVYSATFYMLTGLHGMHVLVGVSLLTICFIRYIYRHFLNDHHLGFIVSCWYWHFVDIVWILLYIVIYLWSSFF